MIFKIPNEMKADDVTIEVKMIDDWRYRKLLEIGKVVHCDREKHWHMPIEGDDPVEVGIYLGRNRVLTVKVKEDT